MSNLKTCPQCGAEYELDQRFCPLDGSTLRMAATTGDLVGSIIADRYHVLRKLGEGGMGQVYLAEHVKMGRRSAVKVMNPSMAADADAVSRFNREAANACKISHPNVAAVYDFGETGDGLLYMAMELVDGPSLTTVIEEQGALPPIRAADITRQAAEALSVAHDMGIVHRDLKPDNIMLARNRDGGDLVKVVDFGIAKAAGNDAQKVTRTGMVIGTPEYMSPEQLAGDTLDGRSDIYSLALVAFTMLTGRLPFPAETAQESMILRLTDRPRTLGEMKPEVGWPADVQAVLDRALSRDPKLRFDTASEFGRALYNVVEHMPASVAATIGTQVMSSSPAAATVPVAVPATRVSAGEPKAIRSTGKRGWLAAAGLVFVLGAGGGAAVLLKDSNTAVGMTGDSASMVKTAGELLSEQPEAADPAPPAVASNDDGSSDTNGKSNAGTAHEPETVRKPAAEPVRSAPPVSAATVDSLLEALDDKVTMNESAASAVLRDIATLSANITTDDQSTHAGLIRAFAQSSMQNNTGACQTLREIREVAARSRFAKRWQIAMTACT